MNKFKAKNRKKLRKLAKAKSHVVSDQTDANTWPAKTTIIIK